MGACPSGLGAFNAIENFVSGGASSPCTIPVTSNSTAVSGRWMSCALTRDKDACRVAFVRTALEIETRETVSPEVK